MKRFFVLIILFALTQLMLFGRNRTVANIPFEMVGNFVVVKLKINDSSKLNFIVDTGVSNTIITELFPEDSTSLNYYSSKALHGLGEGSNLNAFVSYGNTFILNRKLQLHNKTVHILKNDIFNLSRQTGSKINGIIGADFFKDYVVKIDYNLRKLKFYEPENFIPEKKYGVMPMTIEGQKMYIHLSVLETDVNHRSIKMLIDTGAELCAWFQTITNDAISIPEKSIHGRIGEGLSGEVNGIFARVPQICIANFCVKNPIVAFPDSAAISKIILNSDRDGTIGSQLLHRFNIIIDTYHKKFYFKPNGYFTNPFKYNIAGIEIAQTLLFLSQVEVIRVWKGSPAELAGIKVGDVLLEINSKKLFNFTLSQVRSMFENSYSRPIIIKILRDNKELEFSVEMKAKI